LSLPKPNLLGFIHILSCFLANSNPDLGGMLVVISPYLYSIHLVWEKDNPEKNLVLQFGDFARASKFSI
jgi:hypothetical protein